MQGVRSPIDRTLERLRGGRRQISRGSGSVTLTSGLLLVFVCFLWGGNMVAIKFSNQGVPPLLAATLRSLVAAACVWALGAVRSRRVWMSGRDMRHGVLIGVLFGFDFLFLYWGTAYTTASRAIIFLYTHPFWVALGAHFVLHDDRIDLRKAAGLVLAFGGMTSVFAAGSGDLPAGYWIGDIMEIAAAIFWAATTLTIKKVSQVRPITHYQTLFAQLLFSVPVLLAGTLVFEWGRPPAWSGTVVTALAYQCLVVAFFSYMLWFWMIHTYHVIGLTAFTFLAPMFGVIFGGVILHDPLPLLLWLGLALVAGGIYMVNKPVQGSREP